MKSRVADGIRARVCYLALLSLICLGAAQAQERIPEQDAPNITEEKLQEKKHFLAQQEAELQAKEEKLRQEELDFREKMNTDETRFKSRVEKMQMREKEIEITEGKARIADERKKLAEERAAFMEQELRFERQKSERLKRVSENKILFTRKIIQTVSIVLIVYLVLFLSVRYINTHIKDIKVRYVMRKNVAYILNIVMLVFIVFVWVQNLSSITIFFSVLGAGVALALQEVILSIAGWVLILVRRPFEIGDRIELGGVKGDVIDIRLFQTSLLEIGNWVNADQSTGRIVNIPNSAILKKENYNYSRGFEYIWNEITILVTFESNWKRAEEIMLYRAQEMNKGLDKIVRTKIGKMESQYMIYYQKLTPIVYVDIKESGIELTLRYLTEAQKRRSGQNVLCRAILEDFEKETDVNFAYTTYRLVR